MQVIIPLTGYGSRFVRAGYKELKPFIQVGGKPIIEWIVKGMYDEEDTFIFVCRQEHLDNDAEMYQRLMQLAPNTHIFAVQDWVKKGPVYDVLNASELIDDTQPCIINYCDFFMQWDYENFKSIVQETDCDGAIPVYTGFHPHLIPEHNVYASTLLDEAGNLIEIKEKFTFSEQKMEGLYSPGNYYFKDGSTLKKYCTELVHSDQDINGEYYASLPYNFMVSDGLKVIAPKVVSYFCQWGTPEDLHEYIFWTEHIKEALCKY